MAVQRFASADARELSARVEELEAEWDVERVLEANASTLALAGVLTVAAGHRKGLWLAGGVLGFLLLHATSGWCPPLPVLRRMGVRTRGEIEREKFVLKYLRGDFEGLSLESARAEPGRVLAAAER